MSLDVVEDKEFVLCNFKDERDTVIQFVESRVHKQENRNRNPTEREKDYDLHSSREFLVHPLENILVHGHTQLPYLQLGTVHGCLYAVCARGLRSGHRFV